MLDGFIQSTLNAKSHDALSQDFVKVLSRLGFDKLVFALLSVHEFADPQKTFPQFTFSSNFPLDFLEHYQRKSLHLIDPIRARVFLSHDPFKWGDVRAKGLSRKQESFFQDMKAAGLHEGIAIPLRGPKGAVAVIGGASSVALENDPLTMIKIKLVAAQYYSSYHRLARVTPDGAFINLSNREREILQWSANGKTRKEIATILGISSHTVNIHSASALRKFGTSNITVAAFKALYLGLIQL